MTDTAATVIELEEFLRQRSGQLTEPQSKECLICYVVRMLGEFGCDTSLRWALRYRDQRAPRATALAERLAQKGGFCDCEILLNGYTLGGEYWVSRFIECRCGEQHGGRAQPTGPRSGADVGELFREEGWPDPFPACLGVRLGSTQPCGLWRVRGRHW